MPDQGDYDMYLWLAGGGGCSLDSSPKKNWVEKAGGLPAYICQVARAVMRGGRGKSQAIAIAVGRVKAWAAGADGVSAATKAKAAKAVAQWEAMKAKTKAGKVVKASREDGIEYLFLSNTESFNTEIVRMAWEKVQHQARAAKRAMAEVTSKYDDGYGDETATADLGYCYIKELWTDFLIVDHDGEYEKVPYTVDGLDVTFGDPVDVAQNWTEQPDDDDDELGEEELSLLGKLVLAED